MIDRDIVSKQLGRSVSRIQPFRVVRRCPAGFPAVIQCEPVPTARQANAGSRVFTTLYWLTCPVMNRHLGRFESEGWIDRLEDVANRNRSVREILRRLNEEYAARRRRAVGPGILRRLKHDRPKMAESLARTGIGGVADPAHVKCLHAHAAFHLVRGGHPFFTAFPQMLADVSDCRYCESLKEQP